MNEIFGADNFRSDITWKRFTGTKIQRQHLAIVTDTVYCYTKTDEYIYEQQYKRYKKEYINNFFKFEDENGKYCIRNFYSEGDGPSRIFFGKSISPPKGHHWRYKQDNIDDLIKKGRIVLDKNGFPKLKMYLNEMKGDPYDSLLDEMHVVQGSSKESRSFPTQNPEKLLRILIESSSYPSHVVLDFFLGSGTTIAAAHKLNRKWIGIELGEHYDSIALLRMKEVLAGKGNHEPCGISNEVNWQGGGFFKYYELEQYEDTLRKVQYEDSDLFDSASQDPYNQYVFLRDLKMLEALEIDYENNEVKVDLRKLYPSIDVPEILSNLLGKYIKKIRRNEVEFENGDKIDLNNLDYKLIKPLIWW
jgi:adenine specific DNA methylase Mod